MKYIPILFSTPMVQSILDGRKTMTRREIKTPRNKLAFGFRINSDIEKTVYWPEAIDEEERGLEGNGCNMECPYGQPGDILWVRENWAKIMNTDGDHIGYYHSTDTDLYNGPWKPSIHMPKEACRLFLQVKSVRVERLQDITEEDAIAEGILDNEDGTYKNYFKQKGLRESDWAYCLLRKSSFQSLWCSINGLNSWDENPWVWVIEFESIEKPIDFK